MPFKIYFLMFSKMQTEKLNLTVINRLN